MLWLYNMELINLFENICVSFVLHAFTCYERFTIWNELFAQHEDGLILLIYLNDMYRCFLFFFTLHKYINFRFISFFNLTYMYLLIDWYLIHRLYILFCLNKSLYLYSIYRLYEKNGTVRKKYIFLIWFCSKC